jgi:hypothetical protein
MRRNSNNYLAIGAKTQTLVDGNDYQSDMHGKIVLMGEWLFRVNKAASAVKRTILFVVHHGKAISN